MPAFGGEGGGALFAAGENYSFEVVFFAKGFGVSTGVAFLVNVLPVPQAMMIFPLSASANPSFVAFSAAI